MTSNFNLSYLDYLQVWLLPEILSDNAWEWESTLTEKK